MRPRALIVLAAFFGISTLAGLRAAQRDRHPEADEYIKLGTRIPPLPPGEGGQLFVTAPPQFCADNRFTLEVNHHPPGLRGGAILKAVAGPSPCRWQFDDMPPGEYSATLTTASDDRIVAAGRGELAGGAGAVVALSAPATELEGTLRVNGSVPPPGLRLIFRNSSKSFLEWDATLDAAGNYKVAVDTTAPKEQVCIHLQREPPMNSVLVKCPPLLAGLQRLDIEATMPRGVLRIDVPPVPDAGFGAFARITISDSDDAERGYLTSFKLIRGLRGDYITDVDRDYRVIVTRYDDKAVLASVRVPLSAERTDARVRLPLVMPRPER
jgi:hypothetical protein